MNEPTSTPAAPAPDRPRRRRPRAHWAWFVVPLVVWLAVIAVNSTDIASSAHTDELLRKVLGLFFPDDGSTSDSGAFGVLSWFVRKLAHVVEYAILAGLLARVARRFLPGFVRGSGWELLWRTAVVALPCGLVVAIADEFHQAFVSTRVGKPTDVVADLIGLVAGVLIVWLAWRRSDRS